MKVSMETLKRLIKEEKEKFLKQPVGVMTEGLITEAPWIGANDELTDICPMCQGDEMQHDASGCDYSQCSFCSYDHSYEYEQAHEFHTANDPEGLQYK